VRRVTPDLNRAARHTTPLVSCRGRASRINRSCLRALPCALALVVLASCASAGPADAPSSIEPLRPPTSSVVLTIEGRVGQPNVGDHIEVDLEGIERLGIVEFTVFEPFLNRDLEMSGVPLAMLLAAAGVDAEAELVWTALDDYQVTFSGVAAASENAMLATRVDGEPISVADGGPTRIVFPKSDGPLGRDSDQWIWSIESVSVT